MLLLLLSRFSRVRLCATPQTAAHQAPPSLGFSRQEHWNGLPFPSPVNESESEVAQSCPTLSDPRDCSLPGSSVHGIFQARMLELGAIAFSTGPITSWEIDGETVSEFIFWGSKITADGDCRHEIKRHLLLGRKVMTNLDSIFKSRDITWLWFLQWSCMDVRVGL